VTTIVVGCASRKILRTILNEVRAMGARIDELAAKVAANTVVVDSAVELLNGLKERLDAAIASGDPAELEALSASLGADTAELAAAVAANTPAE
jgi:outer membrane murein-binding lipoprotein Lpp